MAVGNLKQIIRKSYKKISLVAKTGKYDFSYFLVVQKNLEHPIKGDGQILFGGFFSVNGGGGIFCGQKHYFEPFLIYI